MPLISFGILSHKVTAFCTKVYKSVRRKSNSSDQVWKVTGESSGGDRDKNISSYGDRQ